MVKRSSFLLIVSLLIILTGCFKGNDATEEIDPPKDAETVENKNVKEEDEEKALETAPRELYLIDVNGMVASQTIDLPNPESNEVAKQVLEHLVEEGPVTSMLPNGFRAVIPQGTEILGLDLQEDGTVHVDLSEEFTEYKAEDEVKILQAMTHTMTQFDSIDKIKLMVNGEFLEEMPVNGTPIKSGYSKENGINLVDSVTPNIIDSQVVTMHYPNEHNESRYYVPITKHIQSEKDHIYEEIVQNLIEGPGYDANVIQVFNPETSLVEEPSLNDGVLELVFNQGILQEQDSGVITDEVMETLVRTLSEQKPVEAVDVKVEDVDELVNENGEVYNEPVTQKSFTPTEEL